MAARWTPSADLAGPDDHVRGEFVWAALDCPSAFPLLEDPAAQVLEPMLLGRLRARQTAPLPVGEPCTVLAWSLGLEGRKGRAGSAIVRADGRPAALAEATWISMAGRFAGAAAVPR